MRYLIWWGIRVSGERESGIINDNLDLGSKIDIVNIYSFYQSLLKILLYSHIPYQIHNSESFFLRDRISINIKADRFALFSITHRNTFYIGELLQNIFL